MATEAGHPLLASLLLHRSSATRMDAYGHFPYSICASAIVFSFLDLKIDLFEFVTGDG